jgi:hypothetical protein
MAVLDKKKSKVSDKVPSSSMADIAFLLLIFFLVTTTFPKDKGLAIVLPEEGGEVAVSQRNQRTGRDQARGEPPGPDDAGQRRGSDLAARSE